MTLLTLQWCASDMYLKESFFFIMISWAYDIPVWYSVTVLGKGNKSQLLVSHMIEVNYTLFFFLLDFF